jgi:radical SAM protein with 4Fe4S-binding SPASM domain
MKLDVLGRVGLGAARANLGGHSAPLTTWMSITNRCDASCSHCAMPFRAQKEMTTGQVHKLIDAIADAGGQSVILTGGEPLVRPDIAELVAHLADRGLWVRIETNGYRYPELADNLRGLGHLAISIDGDEATNDSIREPGAYGRAIAALDAAVARGVRTSTVTVLTAPNIDALDAVLSLCEYRNILAYFRTLHFNEDLDGGASASLRASDADTRRALRFLIEARRQGRNVANTEKTLRTMLAWEDYSVPYLTVPQEDQYCMAGKTHIFIDSDGTMYPCRQRVGTTPARPTSSPGRADALAFADAFTAMQSHGCQACAATDLCERNAVDALNLPAILGIAKNWRRSRLARKS